VTSDWLYLFWFVYIVSNIAAFYFMLYQIDESLDAPEEVSGFVFLDKGFLNALSFLLPWVLMGNKANVFPLIVYVFLTYKLAMTTWRWVRRIDNNLNIFFGSLAMAVFVGGNMFVILMDAFNHIVNLSETLNLL
jgi:hypothetical protein